MKPTLFLSFFALCSSLFAQTDGLKSKTTYAKAYGTTNNPVALDPAKDLPRYPAVEPKDAIATWQVKKGYKLELAAHEPQVRSPIAVCFDERGRMFACEMIDYSEMRDETPHLGRVSMLEDQDGDGYFETSKVFAEDLAWPTGIIWANGGLYVIATPDIWFFKDGDGDGKAEVREKIFTGFGTGLKLLNVQGLANSPQWGQDNRIHILAGGGNRGVITCLKRLDLKSIELGGKDFWFDPRTHEFGLEGGGAQYGMSFDNYGRKFACSNSDHLQYWVYDDKYANRNPYYQMPPARQSIAVDGGAAEVFRISPDEPWRIVRTRWRIAGVVKGAVEGGGRVSGYFTGATGTTIYRGDALGDEFLNNSFTGDAGGQLVHRKIIRPSADGVSLVGERPADERGYEFAASKDTWVRVVNFANAPDGSLHICDMYREVIEHPWSIPDEIKKHVDLNSGNNRGRVYRIVRDEQGAGSKEQGAKQRGTKVNLADATTEELVKTLSHPNGWHRDTAQRLLYERQDKTAVPLLERAINTRSHHLIPPTDGRLRSHGRASVEALLHSLGALDGLGALKEELLITRLQEPDPILVERAIHLSGAYIGKSQRVSESLMALKNMPSPRVRFALALRLGDEPGIADSYQNTSQFSPNNWLSGLLFGNMNESNTEQFKLERPWMTAAIASAPAQRAAAIFGFAYQKCPASFDDIADTMHPLLKSAAATGDGSAIKSVISVITDGPRPIRPSWIRSLAEGLRISGTGFEEADTSGKLAAVFTKAASTATDTKDSTSSRLEAIELIGLTSSKEARAALLQCLTKDQPDAVQAAAVKTMASLSSAEVTTALLQHWPDFGAKAKAAALEALLSRDDRVVALLEANVMKPGNYSAAQVQALIKHKDAKIASLAKTVLASVIPPSREEMVAKFKPALGMKGDVTRGQAQYLGRCIACHVAAGQGIAVGPDLITVKTKGREALLTAILEPHKEIASQYIAYTVNTKDGQTLAGIITDDNATSLTLKMMGGATVNVPRANVKGSSSSGQSLMPEGLEQGMTVQDMADMLDFIEALK